MARFAENQDRVQAQNRLAQMQAISDRYRAAAELAAQEQRQFRAALRTHDALQDLLREVVALSGQTRLAA